MRHVKLIGGWTARWILATTRSSTSSHIADVSLSSSRHRNVRRDLPSPTTRRSHHGSCNLQCHPQRTTPHSISGWRVPHEPAACGSLRESALSMFERRSALSSSAGPPYGPAGGLEACVTRATMRGKSNLDRRVRLRRDRTLDGQMRPQIHP
ncbi:hypothetical protein OH77DRAFT_169523 [Trametes cingulata]|nr:hypothetical protein OH77DRAFT_169523 [Trametes cingulata]